MKKKYEMLREKMRRFNAWEAEKRRCLTPEDRMRQFFLLYNLGQFYSEDIISQVHKEHLKGLIDTNKRLRDAKIKSSKKRNSSVV